MNVWIIILLIAIYIFIVAIIMGVMCKYESAGNDGQNSSGHGK